VDGGRFPVKRTEGDTLVVWADVFKPGHESILGALELRGPAGATTEATMSPFDNDRWVGRARLGGIGEWAYRVSSWTDVYGTKLRSLEKWLAAGEDVSADLARLVDLLEDAAARANGSDAASLTAYARRMKSAGTQAESASVAEEEPAASLMQRYGRRDDKTTSPEFRVVVDRKEAVYAAWYEMFHRSQGKSPAKGATFQDCVARLPDVASMGFDVV
jgi:starch synthase (maltosyl-transferring)